MDDIQRVNLLGRVRSVIAASENACGRAAHLCTVAQMEVFNSRQERSVARCLAYLRSGRRASRFRAGIDGRPRLVLLPGGAGVDTDAVADGARSD
jgi:hypothetical protein